ncbi:MAG: DNA-cytosine methyltransferase [Nitrospira sp.]|jgi:DNA (cytosine-5)-methyltransferase 1|nr:MAG: DNA-cytosine methyltransferase [Nitrospira sp.]
MSNNRKPVLNAIDLFSGCGGLTLGLKKAGFSVIGAVELDKRAVETYGKNHPEVKVFQQDVLTIGGKDLLERLGIKMGDLDLLAGCPPCQGFSRIRRRNRRRISKDHRNDLVLKFTKLIAETSPKAVMLENVPGLEKDRRFSKLLGTLRRHGYKFSWKILDACNFGVPQRRRRLVVLACKAKRPIVDEIATLDPKTVRQTIGTIEHPRKSKRPLHRLVADYSDNVKMIIRKIPKDGGSRSVLPTEMTLECHQRLAGFRDVYGRMTWDNYSPTITGGCVNPSKGRFLHPTQHRAITVFEASLLQSFPRTYKFLPKYGRYPNAEMIGNALPPRFAKQVSSYIAGILNKVD